MERRTQLKAKAPLKQRASLKSRQSLKSGGGQSAAKTKKRVPLEKQTAQQLRKPADKWFSKYIRLRDSVCTGDEWVGTCITCTKTGVVAWIDQKNELRFTKGWDNGHFVTRGNYVVRYNEMNCNLQCSFRCNKMRSGEYVKYKSALKDKYGSEVPGELEALADEQPGPTYHFTKAELLQIISDCKTQVECIKENR